MLYSEDEKVKLCKVIRIEEVRLLRECVFFGHENMQHEDGSRKGNHELRYHLYLIPEDVALKYAVAFSHVDSM